MATVDQMEWHPAMHGRLAGAPRPGHHEHHDEPVPLERVDEWIARAREMGVRSIICLLADEHLRLYEQALPDGLIEYYRTHGFVVRHVPVRDHANPPLSDDELAEVERAHAQLEEPVLIHCSAGIGRTGCALRHLAGVRS